MATSNTPEAWLRGPVTGISPWLQPVAHALIQAREEVAAAMEGFPDAHLWEKPADVASVGFHLQHLKGVLDRLFTYARGQSLTQDQLSYLAAEGKPPEAGYSVPLLVQNFNEQVDKALEQLQATKEEVLLQHRGVGRAQLPSNVLGLLFHAAEHTQRHLGQLLVTARVVKA